MYYTAFLLWALPPTSALAADDLSDFSNNLATDIAPLLVLFGDAMTKQYLSESTSAIDYLIFALGPIGLMSAIVSVIRVCGHASLRAFIGRSQEGDGAVEAELCTSTSRDVAEVFTRGGIARVLGRPKILEFVHFPRRLATRHMSNRVGGTKRVINAFDYFPPSVSQDYEWKEVGRPKSIEEGLGTDVRSVHQRNLKNIAANIEVLDRLAPMPNLSLNVGIVKRPYWILVAVAITGLALQVGVLVVAGTGVWVLEWDLGERTSASRNYAPVMFIVGTLMMCVGMGCCAALIGKATRKVIFKRRPSDHSSRLIWLQPGGQKIGDQTFDSYAFIESPDNPLPAWTSSTRVHNEKFERYALVAVIVSLAGYIMQFIGLRGMKAWVSLSQLGVTIIMTILRGSLRMKRLHRNDNRVGGILDIVLGHELDWLVFEIEQLECSSKLMWYLTGEYEEGESVTDPFHQLANSDPRSPGYRMTISDPEKIEYPNSICSNMLEARIQLGGMVDGTGLAPENRLWGDNHIKAREVARKLAAALCSAAASLINYEGYRGKLIVLKIRARAMPIKIGGPEEHSQEDLIRVILEPPFRSGFNRTSKWFTDDLQLEGILGLWMWSLISNHPWHREKSEEFRGNRYFRIRHRVVSAGPETARCANGMETLDDLELWLGPPRHKHKVPSTTTLSFRADEDFGPFNNWSLDELQNTCVPIPPARVAYNKDYFYGWAPVDCFYGWAPVHEALRTHYPDRKPGQRIELPVRYITSVASILSLCHQEVYTILLGSLACLIEVEDTTVVEVDGHVRFNNPTVNTLVNGFLENGLGERKEEALPCVISALGSRLSVPSDEEVATALLEIADKNRRAGEWQRAEKVFLQACGRYCALRMGDCSPSHCAFAAKLFRAGGELYRWSLRRSEAGSKFAADGIDKMYADYRKPCHDDCQVGNSLECYKDVIGRIIASPTLTTGNTAVANEKALVQAIRERNRRDTLLYLHALPEDTFWTRRLAPALPLAVRNDWSEVVSALLEMGAKPNSGDENLRTALSYCAELGLKSYLGQFLDLGADPNLADKSLRTPMLWAAEKGQKSAAKVLLESGGNVEARDFTGRTPLSWAAGGGHVDVVRLLLDGVADIETVDEGGKSPLMYAAEQGHAEVVEILIEMGAYVHLEDSESRTARLWAESQGHSGVADTLRSAELEVCSSETEQAAGVVAEDGDTEGSGV